MAIDTVTPRSRRALLAAATGSLAALAAQALGRPASVRATDGDPVLVGAYHAATGTTTIENTSSVNSSAAYSGYATGASGTTYGLRGQSDSSSGTGVLGLASAASGTNQGVFGQSDSSSGTGVKGLASAVSGSTYGVYGQSTSGIGVQGRAPGLGVQGEADGPYGTGVRGLAQYYGVRGIAYSPDGAGVSGLSVGTGVRGESNGNRTAVYGYSGSGFSPAAPAKTGVYGRATQDASARGVHGYSTVGRGVYGQATSGRGIYGYASSGVGVYARAGASGKALHAQGRVSFSTAGLAPIGAGASSALVAPGVDLTSGSKVLCTLMGNAGGTTTVERVAVNTTTDSFTIYLTGPSANAVKVAWFVIG